MWPDGAFRVLLLISSVTALTVPPPTNVKVTCKNLRVVVNWEFSDQQPHTSFRVESKSNDGHLLNVTTEHQFDLSGFIWESQDQYMNFHAVKVTALQEGAESTPVPSESFSFNKGKMVDKQCLLDFPPVEVVAGDSGNIVRFPNPYHFYTKLKPKKEASFTFNVSSDQRNYTSTECSQSVRECRFDLPPGEEACVRVGGWLDGGNKVERVDFIRTGLICPSNTSDARVFTFVFLLIALVLIISGLSIAIYKVRAWTLTIKQAKAEALDIDPNHEKYGLLKNNEEVFSQAVVLEPGCSSSVSSEDADQEPEDQEPEDQEPEDQEPEDQEPEDQEPEDQEPEDQEPEDQEPALLQNVEAVFSPVEGVKPGCSSSVSSEYEGRPVRGDLEEPEDQEPEDQEPAAVGNYDRLHVLLDVKVDLGDGEMTDAYREG
ncbi:interferon gamma receptor 1 [Limanda limanda]|uniref:interferon gamma receptor 1 n=1 Tax=Limanda limanda TaxID=27771 RepID=UPI0029C9AA0D|nr:interferon gamma receptor 1 [Limanda limanda]